MGHSANAAQAQRWNGESGQHWIAHRERLLEGHRRLVPHLFGAAAISAGDRVLDVGCGCGATTIAAAREASGPALARPDGGVRGPSESGFGGSALGVDLSGPMLQVARRLAAEAGVANAGFVQADAQVCPLRPDSCDVVISSFGVMFFDDPAAAFANIATALRHRGRLAFLSWQDDRRNELFSIPLRAFGAHPRPPGQDQDDLFTDPRKITQLLSGAGCAHIQIEEVSELAWMGSDVPDVMSYVRGMRMIRNLAAEHRDDALTERALAAVAGHYAARQRPDGVWVRAGAWLVTADRG